jgi:hypothetical protein
MNPEDLDYRPRATGITLAAPTPEEKAALWIRVYEARCIAQGIAELAEIAADEAVAVLVRRVEVEAAHRATQKP